MNGKYTEQAELTTMTGSDNWGDVVEWFSGKTVEEITNELDLCFSEPREELIQLAARIYDALPNDVKPGNPYLAR